MSLSNQIAKEVTTKIIDALRTGCAPWVKPWKSVGPNRAAGLPYNHATRKAYRGINVILLQIAGMQYSSQAWLTYKQAQELGGFVRKGEKGTRIIFWKPLTVKGEQDDGEAIERTIPLLREYTVFNLEQCENVRTRGKETEPTTVSEFEAHERAEELLAKSGAIIRHGGDSAFYSPSHDFVQMPHKEQFTEAAGYYATALHELTHWTGHSKRLAREYGKRFGDQAYAREELVAEIGAAFLCTELGVQGELRHAAYVKSWIKVLENDHRAIFVASAHAQKAADLVLAKVEEEEKIAA